MLLGTLHLCGCGAWRVLPPAEPAAMFGRWEDRDAASEDRRPREVFRITRRSGAQIELTSPAVRADSIVDDRSAVALSDVAMIEGREFSGKRTLALIATPFLVVGALAMWFGAACQSTPQCGD